MSIFHKSLMVLFVAATSVLIGQVVAYAGPSALPAGYSLKLPSKGQIQAGGTSAIFHVSLACPRGAGDAVVGITVSNGAAGGVAMQYSELLEAHCTGNAKSLVLFAQPLDPIALALHAGPGRLGVEVTFTKNLIELTRTKTLTLLDEPVPVPGLHAVTLEANGAALAIHTEIPCAANDRVAVAATAAQVVLASTPLKVQTVDLRQTVVCQRPQKTVTLFANAAVVPWHPGQVAVSIFDVCRTKCRDVGLAGTAEVTR